MFLVRYQHYERLVQRMNKMRTSGTNEAWHAKELDDGSHKDRIEPLDPSRIIPVSQDPKSVTFT